MILFYSISPVSTVSKSIYSKVTTCKSASKVTDTTTDTILTPEKVLSVEFTDSTDSTDSSFRKNALENKSHKTMDLQIEKVVDQALRIEEPFKRTTFLQACYEKFQLDEEKVIKAMNIKLIQRRNQN